MLQNDAKIQDNARKLLAKLNVRVDICQIVVQSVSESNQPVVTTITFPGEESNNTNDFRQ